MFAVMCIFHVDVSMSYIVFLRAWSVVFMWLYCVIMLVGVVCLWLLMSLIVFSMQVVFVFVGFLWYLQCDIMHVCAFTLVFT